MEKLQVTEKTYNKRRSNAGVCVWAKDLSVDRSIPPVGILDPDECFSEYRLSSVLLTALASSRATSRLGSSPRHGKVEAGLV